MYNYKIGRWITPLKGFSWLKFLAALNVNLSESYYCRYSWYGLSKEFKDLPTSEQTDEAKQTVHTWLIYAAIITLISVRCQ